MKQQIAWIVIFLIILQTKAKEATLTGGGKVYLLTEHDDEFSLILPEEEKEWFLSKNGALKIPQNATLEGGIVSVSRFLLFLAVNDSKSYSVPINGYYINVYNVEIAFQLTNHQQKEIEENLLLSPIFRVSSLVTKSCRSYSVSYTGLLIWLCKEHQESTIQSKDDPCCTVTGGSTTIVASCNCPTEFTANIIGDITFSPGVVITSPSITIVAVGGMVEVQDNVFFNVINSISIDGIQVTTSTAILRTSSGVGMINILASTSGIQLTSSTLDAFDIILHGTSTFQNGISVAACTIMNGRSLDATGISILSGIGLVWTNNVINYGSTTATVNFVGTCTSSSAGIFILGNVPNSLVFQWATMIGTRNGFGFGDGGIIFRGFQTLIFTGICDISGTSTVTPSAVGQVGVHIQCKMEIQSSTATATTLTGQSSYYGVLLLDTVTVNVGFFLTIRGSGGCVGVQFEGDQTYAGSVSIIVDQDSSSIDVSCASGFIGIIYDSVAFDTEGSSGPFMLGRSRDAPGDSIGLKFIDCTTTHPPFTSSLWRAFGECIDSVLPSSECIGISITNSDLDFSPNALLYGGAHHSNGRGIVIDDASIFAATLTAVVDSPSFDNVRGIVFTGPTAPVFGELILSSISVTVRNTVTNASPTSSIVGIQFLADYSIQIVTLDVTIDTLGTSPVIGFEAASSGFSITGIDATINLNGPCIQRGFVYHGVSLVGPLSFFTGANTESIVVTVNSGAVGGSVAISIQKIALSPTTLVLDGTALGSGSNCKGVELDDIYTLSPGSTSITAVGIAPQTTGSIGASFSNTIESSTSLTGTGSIGVFIDLGSDTILNLYAHGETSGLQGVNSHGILVTTGNLECNTARFEGFNPMGNSLTFQSTTFTFRATPLACNWEFQGNGVAVPVVFDNSFVFDLQTCTVTIESPLSIINGPLSVAGTNPSSSIIFLDSVTAENTLLSNAGPSYIYKGIDSFPGQIIHSGGIGHFCGAMRSNNINLANIIADCLPGDNLLSLQATDTRILSIEGTTAPTSVNFNSLRVTIDGNIGITNPIDSMIVQGDNSITCTTNCAQIRTTNDQFYLSPTGITTMESLTIETLLTSSKTTFSTDVSVVTALRVIGSSLVSPFFTITTPTLICDFGEHNIIGDIVGPTSLRNAAILSGTGNLFGTLFINELGLRVEPSLPTSTIAPALFVDNLSVSETFTLLTIINTASDYSFVTFADFTIAPAAEILLEFQTAPGLTNPGEQIFPVLTNRPDFNFFTFTDPASALVVESIPFIIPGMDIVIPSYIESISATTAFSVRLNTPPIAVGDSCTNSCIQNTLCSCCEFVLLNDVDRDLPGDTLVPVFVSGGPNYTINPDGSICYDEMLGLINKQVFVNYVAEDSFGTQSNTVQVQFSFVAIPATPSNTPSVSPTPSLSPTGTDTPTTSNTASRTPTMTSTSTPSITGTISSTETPTNSPTSSPTQSQTATPSESPSGTLTPTMTPTPTPSETTSTTSSESKTSSQTKTPSNSETSSVSGTRTSSKTSSSTSSVSNSNSGTITATGTPTGTETETSSPTVTNSPSGTLTGTQTGTQTQSSSTSPSTTPNTSLIEGISLIATVARSASNSMPLPSSSPSYSASPSESNSSSSTRTESRSSTSSISFSVTSSESRSNSVTVSESPSLSISLSRSSNASLSNSMSASISESYSRTSSRTMTESNSSLFSITNFSMLNTMSSSITESKTGLSSRSETSSPSPSSSRSRALNSVRNSEYFPSTLSNIHSRSPMISLSVSAVLGITSLPLSNSIIHESNTICFSASPSPSASQSKLRMILIPPNPPDVQPIPSQSMRTISSSRRATIVTSNIPESLAEFSSICEVSCSFNEIEITIPFADNGNFEIQLAVDEERTINAFVEIPSNIVPMERSNATLSVNILTNIPRNNVFGDTIIDITLVDAFGNEITLLPNSVRICLPASDLKKDETCLGYFDKEKNEWVCEDNCLERNGDYFCGDTDHFTSFALLLQGKEAKCGEDDDLIVIWLSLVAVGCAVSIIVIALILIEIRYRVYARNETAKFKKIEKNLQAAMK